MRRATFSDLPRLHELLLDMQKASKHAGDVDVDEPTAKALMMQAIQRNGGTNAGSCLVIVEETAGRVEGFILGTLQRLYHIGNRLEAVDMFLHCTPKAPARAATKLIDAYVEWADPNPKVAKIILSWTDIIGVDGARIGKLYAMKGFHRVGEIWERSSE